MILPLISQAVGLAKSVLASTTGALLQPLAALSRLNPFGQVSNPFGAAANGLSVPAPPPAAATREVPSIIDLHREGLKRKLQGSCMDPQGPAEGAKRQNLGPEEEEGGGSGKNSAGAASSGGLWRSWGAGSSGGGGKGVMGSLAAYNPFSLGVANAAAAASGRLQSLTLPSGVNSGGSGSRGSSPNGGHKKPPGLSISIPDAPHADPTPSVSGLFTIQVPLSTMTSHTRPLLTLTLSHSPSLYPFPPSRQVFKDLLTPEELLRIQEINKLDLPLHIQVHPPLPQTLALPPDHSHFPHSPTDCFRPPSDR